MRNPNKHALTNCRRLLWICDTSFWGDALLFVGFSSSFILELWRLKSSDIFCVFNWWREKSWKEGIYLFVPLVCTVCWLNISCTNCWSLKNVFWGRGDKEGGKRWEGRNPKKRRILMNTQACLRFQNSPTADSGVHFNFSLVTHRFLSLKSLLLICAKCLMLWDHSEYHLLDNSPRNQR